MSYIGNSPTNIAFQTDTFSGTGSQTAFTMSVAPANTTSVIVAITGVLQDPSTYSVSGTTLTFSAAPPSGTSNISVRYLGIPASGVTTTAYRTVTNTTATAGQTSFSIPSYTVGYIDVYRNGVYLPTSDYTATTGTTVVLNNGATVGDTITTVSFLVSSVLNALPTTGGTLTGQLVVNGATGQNPLITQVNSTEVMRIDSSGNMGIGAVPSTSGANARALEFNYGNISTYGGTEFDVAANAYIVGSGWIYKTTAAATLFQQTGGVFSFQTAASGTVGTSASFTERMRIDSSGNVGIGTATPSSFALLAVENSSNNRAGWFYVSAASSLSTPSVTFVKKDNNTTTSQVLANFYVNGSLTAQGQINANGASAAAFGSFSDQRLKENITDLPPQLANIMALRTVEFDYIESEGGGHQIGFIAQEVQQVYPDLVGEREDGMLTLTDLNKNDARLIKAIQEQQALITQLQADVTALKQKVGV